MGQYNMSHEEFINELNALLRDQEGDVSAQVIAECYNALAEHYEWSDRLAFITEENKQWMMNFKHRHKDIEAIKEFIDEDYKRGD